MSARQLLSAVAIAFACACTNPPIPEDCAHDGGEYVNDFAVVPVQGRVSESDAGTSIPLQILASVPCLRGGARAVASSSVGTIGGVGPGATTTVFLAPVETGFFEGKLEGEVVLLLPGGRTARVQVDFLDESLAVKISRTEDGGVQALP